jgi:LmbE family N-acetylglucosaminyl deacetylase
MDTERVLLLVPHPDDELVGVAVAIERLLEQGGEVYAAYLTTGVPASAGSWLGGRFAYPRAVARRWLEATRVSAVLGLSFAGRQMIPSRELKSHLRSSLDWARELAETLRVDRVWVPAYEGGHQDHDVASFIGARLTADFAVWEFAEYNFAGGAVQSQTFVEPNGSEVELTLDEPERGRKRSLLGLYASEQKNLGYVGLEREALRPLADYDYMQPPHPGKTFYQRFQWVPYHPRIDYCRPEQVCQALSGVD